MTPTRFRAVLICALCAPLPLAAQTNVAFGSLQHDTSQPVEVTSDNLSIENEAGIAVFDGNVVVIQGDMRLAAARIRVEYGTGEDGGTNDIDEMFATGGVTFTNGVDNAEAAEATYRPDDGDLLMTGDVVLTQGPSIISGEQLTVDLDAGTGVMEGRVRTIFQSEQN